MSSHEFDYELWYAPEDISRHIKIYSGVSMDMLKEAAKKDAEEHSRLLNRYIYQYTTSGMLFNLNELSWLNEQIDR